MTDTLDWRDALVELHVLAEHGDTAAAQEAGSWLTRDAHARAVWETVDDACRAVRAEPAT